MATTANIQLTHEQRSALASDLRVKLDDVPQSIAVIAISPEAAKTTGIEPSVKPSFSPALIIT